VVGMELRQRVRYSLRANAVFSWEGAKRTRLLGEGVTRDISLTGAFILTLTSPPVGTAIRLEVFLLPLESGARSVRMKTEATVLRVEHANGGEGFAVAIENIALVEGKSDLLADR
jgi:PilZ domain-containing protein